MCSSDLDVKVNNTLRALRLVEIELDGKKPAHDIKSDVAVRRMIRKSDNIENIERARKVLKESYTVLKRVIPKTKQEDNSDILKEVLSDFNKPTSSRKENQEVKTYNLTFEELCNVISEYDLKNSVGEDEVIPEIDEVKVETVKEEITKDLNKKTKKRAKKGDTLKALNLTKESLNGKIPEHDIKSTTQQAKESREAKMLKKTIKAYELDKNTKKEIKPEPKKEVTVKVIRGNKDYLLPKEEVQKETKVYKGDTLRALDLTFSALNGIIPEHDIKSLVRIQKEEREAKMLEKTIKAYKLDKKTKKEIKPEPKKEVTVKIVRGNKDYLLPKEEVQKPKETKVYKGDTLRALDLTFSALNGIIPEHDIKSLVRIQKEEREAKMLEKTIKAYKLDKKTKKEIKPEPKKEVTVKIVRGNKDYLLPKEEDTANTEIAVVSEIELSEEVKSNLEKAVNEEIVSTTENKVEEENIRLPKLKGSKIIKKNDVELKSIFKEKVEKQEEIEDTANTEIVDIDAEREAAKPKVITEMAPVTIFEQPKSDEPELPTPASLLDVINDINGNLAPKIEETNEPVKKEDYTDHLETILNPPVYETDKKGIGPVIFLVISILILLGSLVYYFYM